MRKGDDLRLQGKASKDCTVCQAFKGHQGSGGSLSQGTAQAPTAFLTPDRLLTLNTLALRNSSSRDTRLLVVRRVLLAGVEAGSDLGHIWLPSCLFHCQGSHESAGHFVRSSSGQGGGAEAGNAGSTAGTTGSGPLSPS